MSLERVKKFYNEGVAYEWNRLERHPVEFEITIRHLAEFTNKRQVIADIGGGPGRYSFYFADKGHNVTLVDLSNENIDFAKNKSNELGIALENYHTLSATNLNELESSKFDIVLCFGPMYHLEDTGDLNKVLEECRRILKKNGILAIVFLTPWSHAFSAINYAPERMTELKPFYFDLIDSQKNTTNLDIEFPNGWNPKPENIRGYMENHYFSTEKLVSLEGPFGQHFESIHTELSKKTYQDWMDYMYKLSTEKSLLGSCAHLLYIGSKLH